MKRARVYWKPLKWITTARIRGNVMRKGKKRRSKMNSRQGGFIKSKSLSRTSKVRMTTRRTKNRGGIQTVNDEEICWRWPNRTNECLEMKNEGTWT